MNIALALMTNPRVLFLDEPSSGLDSFTANEVMVDSSSHGMLPRQLPCSCNHLPCCINLLLSHESHSSFSGAPGWLGAHISSDMPGRVEGAARLAMVWPSATAVGLLLHAQLSVLACCSHSSCEIHCRGYRVKLRSLPWACIPLTIMPGVDTIEKHGLHAPYFIKQRFAADSRDSCVSERKFFVNDPSQQMSVIDQESKAWGVPEGDGSGEGADPSGNHHLCHNSCALSNHLRVL